MTTATDWFGSHAITGVAARRYWHTLVWAYRRFGIDIGSLSDSVPNPVAAGKGGDEAALAFFSEMIRSRLARLPGNLGDQFLDVPRLRQLEVGGVIIGIPILNIQGNEWYGSSPIENFDFTVESRIGLLDSARVVYDLGGHHGVWAAYYAMAVGETGRVYTFEPSIVNVEISALLFLINNLNNVLSYPMAIGAMGASLASGTAASEGMLIDFVGGDVEVIPARLVSVEPGDFLKMDIEGFEYDVLTSCPWFFDLATNMHLELHIPHLEARAKDYREVFGLIPFEKFDVWNYQGGRLESLQRDSTLSGFCSLMLKRKAA